MNYSDTLAYLYSRLPMYQRIGAAAYKANLDNTLAICKLLGNPENKFKSVHIAGTNGKGSVSHMLASVLQCAGYKVGLYTSPHLKDFRERVKINGKMISKNYVEDFVTKYKSEFEKIKPSFFEWTVGLAFEYFAKEKVDIAIIETGLGGRLDSTNVITPLLSIITNISYDHQNLLGDTLDKIALEKAGIIKKNGIVIIGEKQKETKKIFENKSKEMNALLLYAEDFSNAKRIECGLKGDYQKKNIPTVLLASEMLHPFGFEINRKAIAKGLKEVCKLTGLRGRWDVFSKKPFIVADIAHNEAGIKEVFKQVKQIPHEKFHIVFGTVNEKDIRKILSLLPKKATYYFCKANIPRGLDEKILAEEAKKIGLKGETYSSVKQALNSAKKNASAKDFILITGSAFVVAEVI
ncbi:MAG: bifunctional folylpolyglutamate synthase/dihydrofolate synthase [Bacteroidetes bacterium]|nr:bifunctional folylpolyglutamate synthase/dihydrofolate synthase [Bacteroidota bacterium]